MSNKKILLIDACAREESRTRRLAEEVLRHLEGEKERLPLYEGSAYPLDENALKQRDQCLSCRSCNGQGLNYAKQFAEADEIVIAAPYWDLSFPSILKAYIENINAIGITFAYDETGQPYSLCRAKKLYYVSTAGGFVLDDDIYGYGYIKALCGRFYGIPETYAFRAEALDLEGNDPEKILEEAVGQIRLHFAG